MKIEEAIEWLGKMQENIETEWGTMGRDAIKLSIEALKAWEKYQAGWVGVYKPLLPGETKD